MKAMTAIAARKEKGFTLITVGVDTVMLGQVARKMLGQIRG